MKRELGLRHSERSSHDPRVKTAVKGLCFCLILVILMMSISCQGRSDDHSFLIVNAFDWFTSSYSSFNLIEIEKYCDTEGQWYEEYYLFELELIDPDYSLITSGLIKTDGINLVYIHTDDMDILHPDIVYRFNELREDHQGHSLTSDELQDLTDRILRQRAE